jgi:3-phosphoshikimate 1-carboxyvinyltransferase
MASIALATVKPARRVRGRIRPASDKSISHRYGLLAALADGRSVIRRYSAGADCAATLDCLERLGVLVERRAVEPAPAGTPDLEVRVTGRGVRGLTAPAGPLDARNSGSTLRMLAGILAAHPFTATLVGDACSPGARCAA